MVVKGKKQLTIIGLVGFPGSGKTTVAKYLERKGFFSITLSDFIKEEIKKNNLGTFTRELLQDQGNKMRQRYGSHILAELAYKKIEQLRQKNIVVDGIRNVAEIRYLREKSHFTLVGVNADSKIRYQRLLKKRGRDFVGSFENFQKQEEREDHLGSQKIGLRVKDCFAQADYIVKNEQTLAELYTRLDDL